MNKDILFSVDSLLYELIARFQMRVQFLFLMISDFDVEIIVKIRKLEFQLVPCHDYVFNLKLFEVLFLGTKSTVRNKQSRHYGGDIKR
jgi:hypothetical protein